VIAILNSANLIKALIIGKNATSIKIEDEKYNTNDIFVADTNLDQIGTNYLPKFFRL